MGSTNGITVSYVEEDLDFERVYSIRASVFQLEHGLAEEAEIDGHEHISHHYLAWIDGVAVGTARWRMTMAGKAKLERFAVLSGYRSQGVGKALAAAIMRQIPEGRVKYVEALESASPFFEKFGFKVEGEPYEVLGLTHVKMVLPG